MSDIEQLFSCARCGYCCQGETTVSLDEDDQRIMCEALGMERDEVAEKYWRITANVVQMKIVDGHCIFYDEGCSVHAGRPWRCREWPLHPSILSDVNNFSTISDSCPGIRKDTSYEEFCGALKKLMATRKKISC
ncbi:MULTISPECIES: YkgJ family cysteine cluster protein [Desulfosediminicola]|uniref:YkgJ family cysteine cluster protein n=1 Tax=Desulfosediminicola TaxID=2886823 RepID=UPI0010ABCA2B|nr:YkgJ family cysteine cluster protein [Desulfosediminicola ganghwensis]